MSATNATDPGNVLGIDNTVADSSVLTSIYINLAIGGALFTLFIIFQSRSVLYRFRLVCPSVTYKPPPLPRGVASLWGWAWVSMTTSDMEFVKTAGLDALMFNKMSALGVQLFLPQMVIGLVVLLPIHHSYDYLATSNGNTSGFQKLTISNVPQKAGIMWLHWVLMYVYLFYSMWLLRWHYRQYIVIRQHYLMKGDAVDSWTELYSTGSLRRSVARGSGRAGQAQAGDGAPATPITTFAALLDKLPLLQHMRQNQVMDPDEKRTAEELSDMEVEEWQMPALVHSGHAGHALSATSGSPIASPLPAHFTRGLHPSIPNLRPRRMPQQQQGHSLAERQLPHQQVSPAAGLRQGDLPSGVLCPNAAYSVGSADDPLCAGPLSVPARFIALVGANGTAGEGEGTPSAATPSGHIPLSAPLLPLGAGGQPSGAERFPGQATAAMRAVTVHDVEAPAPPPNTRVAGPVAEATEGSWRLWQRRPRPSGGAEAEASSLALQPSSPRQVPLSTPAPPWLDSVGVQPGTPAPDGAVADRDLGTRHTGQELHDSHLGLSPDDMAMLAFDEDSGSHGDPDGVSGVEPSKGVDPCEAPSDQQLMRDSVNDDIDELPRWWRVTNLQSGRLVPHHAPMRIRDTAGRGSKRKEEGPPRSPAEAPNRLLLAKPSVRFRKAVLAVKQSGEAVGVNAQQYCVLVTDVRQRLYDDDRSVGGPERRLGLVDGALWFVLPRFLHEHIFPAAMKPKHVVPRSPPLVEPDAPPGPAAAAAVREAEVAAAAMAAAAAGGSGHAPSPTTTSKCLVDSTRCPAGAPGWRDPGEGLSHASSRARHGEQPSPGGSSIHSGGSSNEAAPGPPSRVVDPAARAARPAPAGKAGSSGRTSLPLPAFTHGPPQPGGTSYFRELASATAAGQKHRRTASAVRGAPAMAVRGALPAHRREVQPGNGAEGGTGAAAALGPGLLTGMGGARAALLHGSSSTPMPRTASALSGPGRRVPEPTSPPVPPAPPPAAPPAPALDGLARIMAGEAPGRQAAPTPAAASATSGGASANTVVGVRFGPLSPAPAPPPTAAETPLVNSSAGAQPSPQAPLHPYSPPASQGTAPTLSTPHAVPGTSEAFPGEMMPAAPHAPPPGLQPAAVQAERMKGGADVTRSSTAITIHPSSNPMPVVGNGGGSINGEPNPFKTTLKEAPYVAPPPLLHDFSPSGTFHSQKPRRPYTAQELWAFVREAVHSGAVRKLLSTTRYSIVSSTFLRLFPEDFDRAVPVLNHRKVDLLLYQLDAQMAAFEKARVYLRRNGRRLISKPRCCGLLGQPYDVLSDSRTRMVQLQQDILRERRLALTEGETPSWFVFFKSQMAAAVAAQCIIHAEDSRNFRVQPAPGPEEVYWPTLWLNWSQREWRTILTLPCVALLLAIPVGVFTGGLNQLQYLFCPNHVCRSLATGAEMVVQIACPQGYSEPNPPAFQWTWYCRTDNFVSWLLKKVLVGWLPALLLTLWQNMVLPILLTLLIQASGHCPSLSSADLRLASHLFYFSVFNVFLGGVLGSALVQQIGKFLSLGPTEILVTLGNALPTSGNYFLNYILFRALVSVPLRLLNPHIGIRMYLLRRYICGLSSINDRDRALLFATVSPRYGAEIGMLMLIFLIGVAFALVSPIILPVAVGFFAFNWLFWRYALLYVYVRKYESGGLFWPHVFQRIVWCLVIQVVFTSCVFIAKQAFVQAGLALVSIPILIFRFDRYCWFRYEANTHHLPLQFAHKAPRTSVDPWVYVPPPLLPHGLGWHPDWSKPWEGWGMPAYGCC